jgi:hypothetical protein
MASPTRAYKVRKKLKKKQLGRARKNKLAKHGSTPSKAAFFGDKSAKK